MIITPHQQRRCLLLVLLGFAAAGEAFTPIRSFVQTTRRRGDGSGSSGSSGSSSSRTLLEARGKGQKERQRLKENPDDLVVSNEFSRPFSSEMLGKGKSMTLSPKPAELEGLAKRFGVSEIAELEATVTTQQRRGLRHCIFLEGSIRGEVVQACAISGVPVPSSIETEFECVLLEDGGSNAAASLAEDGDYDIEEMSSGMADLGEIVAQYFALEISTYPTAPDAQLPELKM